MSQLRFSRLKLRNWRNFDKVDVPIADRAFIVGPNAAGKSNLLDSLSFLHDIARVRGGLQDAVAERHGVSRIRNSNARKKPDVSIEVEVSSGATRKWKYRLEFRQDRQTRIAVVNDERVWQWAATDDDAGWHELVSQSHQGDERSDQTLLEQYVANRDFRDLSEFFAKIRYRHLVPQLVRDAGRSTAGEDPFGRSLLQRMAETQQRSRTKRLRQIGIALSSAVPGLQNIEWSPDPKSGVPHITASFSHWRPGNARRDERELSDGTLRLVGLLWELFDASDVLLLEEPELSLHERLVTRLPALFATTARHRTNGASLQTIVTTHSARMLDDEGIGLDEVLIVAPGEKYSRVTVAGDSAEIRALVDAGGVPLGDVIEAETAPGEPGQIILDLGD